MVTWCDTKLTWVAIGQFKNWPGLNLGIPRNIVEMWRTDITLWSQHEERSRITHRWKVIIRIGNAQVDLLFISITRSCFSASSLLNATKWLLNLFFFLFFEHALANIVAKLIPRFLFLNLMKYTHAPEIYLEGSHFDYLLSNPAFQPQPNYLPAKKDINVTREPVPIFETQDRYSVFHKCSFNDRSSNATKYWSIVMDWQVGRSVSPRSCRGQRHWSLERKIDNWSFLYWYRISAFLRISLVLLWFLQRKVDGVETNS